MKDYQCEVLIIGAGPAGLAAARAAGESGLQILILDDNPRPGGQIWRDGPAVRLPALAQDYRQAIDRDSHITLLCATQVVAQHGPQHILYEDAESSGTIHYQQLILCSGARVVTAISGWTLPGSLVLAVCRRSSKSGLPLAGGGWRWRAVGHYCWQWPRV